MRSPKLIRNYSKYGDAKLDLKADVIAVALTGNDNFPEPMPAFDDFSLAAKAFSDALKKAASGGRMDVSQKNEARKKLLNAMRSLATIIEGQSANNRLKLLSSGFDLGSEGDSNGQLDAPQEFKLSEGKNLGEVKFSIKAVANATSYIFQYQVDTLTIEGTWISKGSSSREYTFTGLPSGKKIYGRVVVIGTKGQEAYSGTQTRIVQ